MNPDYMESIRNGGKARFFNVLDLVNQLEQEKLGNRGGKLAEQMVRHDLVILDGLGYLPFSKNGGQLLFHSISKHYERTSLIITTNLTFGEWPQVFGDGTLGQSHPSLRNNRNRERKLENQNEDK